MMRIACVALLLGALLAGCQDDPGQLPPCDLIPLTPGNWWRWRACATCLSLVDTVGTPAVMDSREYFPMRHESLGLRFCGARSYFRMDEACRLVVWNGGVEKVFIDFGAPILTPWSLRLTGCGLRDYDYQIQILSKRASSSIPRGQADNCYLVEILAVGLTDASYWLGIAPGIGVIKISGGMGGEMNLVDYHVAGR